MNGELKRISEIVQSEFYPEAEVVREKILDKEYVLTDGFVYRNRWGRESVCIVFRTPSDEKLYKTFSSSGRIVRKVKEVLNKGQLSVLFRFVKKGNALDIE